MRAIAAIPFTTFLFVICVRADDEAERKAIGRVIASLKDPSLMNAAFTKNGDGWVRFAQVRKNTPAGACQIVGPSKDAGRPTVKPSDEPWGESDIDIPPEWRAWYDAIRFVTKDVALVDATGTFEDSGATPHKPLLFVVKKPGADWKIASLRLSAGP